MRPLTALPSQPPDCPHCRRLGRAWAAPALEAWGWCGVVGRRGWAWLAPDPGQAGVARLVTLHETGRRAPTIAAARPLLHQAGSQLRRAGLVAVEAQQALSASCPHPDPSMLRRIGFVPVGPLLLRWDLRRTLWAGLDEAWHRWAEGLRAHPPEPATRTSPPGPAPTHRSAADPVVIG